MNKQFLSLIFSANLVFLLLFSIQYFLGFTHSEFRILRILGSGITLSVIFLLPSMNLTATAILYCAKKQLQRFDIFESISIAAVCGLFFLPLLFLLETQIPSDFSLYLPLINTLISCAVFASLVTLFHFHKKNNTRDAVKIFSQTTYPEEFPVRTALLISFGALLTSIFIIVIAYYPLPDLDPYSWITAFREYINTGTIPSLASYRPLFSSLTYLFSQSAHVDMYAYFKYILPFIALFPLLPAILVARRFSAIAMQCLVFLLPVANASFFFYSTTPIPQAISNVALLSSIYFLIYSSISGKKFFFYLAGAILFSTFFYHEAIAIPLALWMTSFLIFERTSIYSFIRNNLLASTLALLLLLSHVTLFAPIFSFVFFWAKQTLEIIISLNMNFAFPAKYTNIDGNNVGWKGMQGVIQYYGYYFGPASFVALFLSIFFLKQLGLHRFFSFLTRDKEMLFLTMSFCVFFAISDIFPRIFNIALLPERSLGLASVFLLAIILLFLHENIRTNKKEILSPFLKKIVPLVLIFGLLINICAALYINNLKRYLISPEQLSSAQWIRENLPKDAIIFSSQTNYWLLSFYAESTFAFIRDQKFYSQENVYNKEINSYTTSKNYFQIDTTKIKSIQEKITRTANTLDNISHNTFLDESALTSVLQQEIENLQSIKALVQSPHEDGNIPLQNRHLYIYFAPMHEKNPYKDRSYLKEDIENKEIQNFFFNKHPKQFRLLYKDKAQHIYLWEIL